MHTTNNVPLSRCRAFLIYGELSEMGRWSKRRWRHAEGLHFSLFSPHKQEKPVSVCHSTHKHTPTHCSKTRAHAQTQTCTTPTIYTHTSHRCLPHANTQSHTPPCNPQQDTRHIQPKISLPPSAPHRHTQANPQGGTGPD